MAITLAVLTFLFVSLSVLATAMLVSSSSTVVTDRRLRELQSALPSAGDAPARFGSMFGVFRRVGKALPRSPKDMSKIRLRLTHAGFRRDDALPLFFGIRAATALGLFLIFSTPMLMRPNMTAAVGAYCSATSCRVSSWRGSPSAGGIAFVSRWRTPWICSW